MRHAKYKAKAVRALTRRRDYLRARVATLENREGWRGLDFDRGELAAVEYALAVIEDAEAIGLPTLGDLSVEERARLRAVLEGESEAA